MQNFHGSLRSPALFNLIINITLLKNLENNTCSYILSSFNMAATAAAGEGNFDMKMQDFGVAKLQELPGVPPPRSALDLTGDLGGPKNPSPNFAPSNPKTLIRA